MLFAFVVNFSAHCSKLSRFFLFDAIWPHQNVEQVRESAEDCSTRPMGNLGRVAD